jgi:hypothetical protein
LQANGWICLLACTSLLYTLLAERMLVAAGITTSVGAEARARAI